MNRFEFFDVIYICTSNRLYVCNSMPWYSTVSAEKYLKNSSNSKSLLDSFPIRLRPQIRWVVVLARLLQLRVLLEQTSQLLLQVLPLVVDLGIKTDTIHLGQGSQTQSDSRAAWDSKKGLEGRIEKSEKNYLQIFI